MNIGCTLSCRIIRVWQFDQWTMNVWQFDLWTLDALWRVKLYAFDSLINKLDALCRVKLYEFDNLIHNIWCSVLCKIIRVLQFHLWTWSTVSCKIICVLQIDLRAVDAFCHVKFHDRVHYIWQFDLWTIWSMNSGCTV